MVAISRKDTRKFFAGKRKKRRFFTPNWPLWTVKKEKKGNPRWPPLVLAAKIAALAVKMAAFRTGKLASVGTDRLQQPENAGPRATAGLLPLVVFDDSVYICYGGTAWEHGKQIRSFGAATREFISEPRSHDIASSNLTGDLNEIRRSSAAFPTQAGDCLNASRLEQHSASALRLLCTETFSVKSLFAHLIYTVKFYDGNTARLARRSCEALHVPVSVARIAPSLLNLRRAVTVQAISVRSYFRRNTRRQNSRRGEPGSIPGGVASGSSPLVGGFSRGSPVSPALAFRRCSILIYFTFIGSQYLAMEGVEFLPSLAVMRACACKPDSGKGGQGKGGEREIRDVLEFSEHPRTQKASFVGFHALSSIHNANTSPVVVRPYFAFRTQPDGLHQRLLAVGPLQYLKGCRPSPRNFSQSRVAPRVLISRIFLSILYTCRLLQQGRRGRTRQREGRIEVSHSPPGPGCGAKTGLITRLPPRRTGFDSRQVRLRFFARGNRAGRCRSSAGFLEDLPLPPPLYSAGAAPYSPLFTFIGSEDLDVKD
ncbi:hypothetical protein PR048_003184 [Dryococelus australis]|uniref:Uncharacterized protein n=1 Tax=Dryococelus australis TaxID=614101 RepID=A0ABQ9INB8_9NEOP|nr:hypothetical protein PR048_003184 [Dryococelus australis]